MLTVRHLPSGPSHPRWLHTCCAHLIRDIVWLLQRRNTTGAGAPHVRRDRGVGQHGAPATLLLLLLRRRRRPPLPHPATALSWQHRHELAGLYRRRRHDAVQPAVAYYELAGRQRTAACGASAATAAVKGVVTHGGVDGLLLKLLLLRIVQLLLTEHLLLLMLLMRRRAMHWLQRDLGPGGAMQKLMLMRLHVCVCVCV